MQRRIANDRIHLVVDNTTDEPVPELEQAPEPPSQFQLTLDETVKNGGVITPEMITARHPVIIWVVGVIIAICEIPSFLRELKSIPARMRASRQERLNK